jgi:hypothetical protein
MSILTRRATAGHGQIWHELSCPVSLRRSYLIIVLRCAMAQLGDEPHFSRPYPITVLG